MPEIFPPHTSVEYIVWQGRSSTYQAAVVVSYSNGTYIVRFQQNGSQVSCNVPTLRLSPPTADAELLFDQGDPLDVYEPTTSCWRAMVAMHSDVFLPGTHQTFLLLHPGDLNIYEYHSPVLRRGLVYTPGKGGAPWQPRPVDHACVIISGKKGPPGSAWFYTGVKKPSGYFATAAATAEAAAAAAASGRQVTYRARINPKPKLQLRLINHSSASQAVAARAHDVWVGTADNFTDEEWPVIRQHLQLPPDGEPCMVPANAAGEAAADNAELEGGDQVAPGVGAKRSRPHSAAQETQPNKRNTTQQQQQQHPPPAATSSRQGEDPAPPPGAVALHGRHFVPADEHPQQQQQHQQGLHLPLHAAALEPPAQNSGAQEAAAAAPQERLAVNDQCAAKDHLPAADQQAEASLRHLSLAEAQQQQQQVVGNQLAGVGEAGQQLVVGEPGPLGAAAGGSRQAGGSQLVAVAGEAVVAAAAPTWAVEVWQPGLVLHLTLMSLHEDPVSMGSYTLRILQKLGAGGECDVWLVELLGAICSSSSSITPEGGSGSSSAPELPAPAAAAVMPAWGLAPSDGPLTYKPMRPRMALKVPFSFDTLLADRQAAWGREAYNDHIRQAVFNECTLLVKCGSCDAVVDSFGWGTVQLASCNQHQQQQQQAAAAAAAAGSSSAPSGVLALPALLLEYAEHATESHQLGTCPPGTGLSSATTKEYIMRVVKALLHLHRAHICHRDIKASNCLLFPAPTQQEQQASPGSSLPQNQTHLLKLADLGIAKIFSMCGVPCSTTQVYTPSYRAPEMQQGQTHDLRVDTWLLGCLLLELRTGLAPFYYLDTALGLSPQEKEARRGAAEFAREDCPYRQVLTAKELAFASTCLEKDITKRPHLSWLLSARGLHAYFCCGL